MSKLMGEDIQVWLSGSCLACAQTCSVNISSDDIDVSCKDSYGFTNSLPGRITWNVSSDNLFVVDDYTKLVDAMLAKQTLTITFGSVSNVAEATEPDEEGHRGPGGGWKSKGDLYYGKVTISSIDLSADNGSIATYSVQFNGHGALAKGNDKQFANTGQE